MSLVMLDPPRPATEALWSRLEVHLSRTDFAEDISSLTEFLRAPVYVIEQTVSLSIGDLDRSRPVAWRFLLGYQKIPWVVGDVTTNTDGSYWLSPSMTVSPMPWTRRAVALSSSSISSRHLPLVYVLSGCAVVEIYFQF
jgi:hypothetical protein